VIVLAVLLLVGCAYLLAVSVRAERRDLAVLKALGAQRRQVLALVHWQATLVAVAILVVGIPAGLLLGRWVVAQFTDALGIVPHVDFAPLVLLAVAASTVLAANVVAVIPGRRAARTSTRALGRDE
jgi:ABC-type antimicrobial peptide transport system permease subunit